MFPAKTMRFVVDKVALGAGFTEYFGITCQFSFHRLLHTNHHLLGRSSTRTVFVRVNRRPSAAEYGRLIPRYVKALLRVYCTRRTRPNATEHGRVTD
jgi:hypothetical protein